MSRREKLRDYIAKCAIAVPVFPVWEFVILAFVFLAGVRGLTGSSMAYLALGTTGSFAWHITMVSMPVMSVIGLFMWPPNGLVITMISKAIISLGCIAVYVGLASAMNTPFYPGAFALLIFGVGATARVVQLYKQLRQLQRGYESLARLRQQGWGRDR